MYIYNICICEAKKQILFFVNKTMPNLKIGYNFVKHFFKSNLYFGRIYSQNVKTQKYFYVQRHRARYMEIWSKNKL